MPVHYMPVCACVRMHLMHQKPDLFDVGLMKNNAYGAGPLLPGMHEHTCADVIDPPHLHDILLSISCDKETTKH